MSSYCVKRFYVVTSHLVVVFRVANAIQLKIVLNQLMHKFILDTITDQHFDCEVHELRRAKTHVDSIGTRVMVCPCCSSIPPETRYALYKFFGFSNTCRSIFKEI